MEHHQIKRASKAPLNRSSFQPKSNFRKKPLSQEQIEFRQDKSEAFILQLKAKSGSIKPEEQERLDLLQTKMSGFFREKIQRAIKAPSGLIPIHSPQRPQPVQPKIEIKPTQKKSIQLRCASAA